MSSWNCPNQIVIWVVDVGETRFMFLLPLTSGPVKAGPFLFNEHTRSILDIS